MKGKTLCAAKQTVFARNAYSADKIPLHNFKNCKFHDVDEKSLVYFKNPDANWANPTDCG